MHERNNDRTAPDHFQGPRRSPRRRPRRAAVIVVVLWTIGIAAILTSSIQLFAYRESSLGLEVVQTVQARWAARSGVEQCVSVLADYTQNPDPDDAFAVLRELQYVSTGETPGGSWDIRHFRDGRTWQFPMDEHAKVNINEADRSMLFLLTDLKWDVADAIIDWRDEDDEVSALGVERDWYLSLESPYFPRNGLLRSTAEMELIAGIWPSDFRGEDWNLNQRLDTSENDERVAWPPDDGDDFLDAGWSALFTAYSRGNGVTRSGLPRLQLKRATVDELMQRLGVDEDQARALIAFGREPENDLLQLISTPLSAIGPSGRVAEGTGAGQDAADLSLVQLEAVLYETSIEHPSEWVPGKININTVSAELLRELINPSREDSELEALADEIIYRRGVGEGIASVLDLLDLPNVTNEQWVQLASTFDTYSNVFTIVSRGRSRVGGIETEIVVVVDRSSVPVRILEYREQ